MDNCCQDVIMNRYRYMQQQTADSAVAGEGSHVGGDDPVLHAVCSSAVTSKTYSTIYTKLQLQRYTSAFKLKSNCNLPAVSKSWLRPSIALVLVKIPFLSADLICTFYRTF